MAGQGDSTRHRGRIQGCRQEDGMESTVATSSNFIMTLAIVDILLKAPVPGYK